MRLTLFENVSLDRIAVSDSETYTQLEFDRSWEGYSEAVGVLCGCVRYNTVTARPLCRASNLEGYYRTEAIHFALPSLGTPQRSSDAIASWNSRPYRLPA